MGGRHSRATVATLVEEVTEARRPPDRATAGRSMAGMAQRNRPSRTVEAEGTTNNRRLSKVRCAAYGCLRQALTSLTAHLVVYEQAPAQRRGGGGGGIGMGGLALGAGAGLLGGALIGGAIEHHEDEERFDAYQDGTCLMLRSPAPIPKPTGVPVPRIPGRSAERLWRRWRRRRRRFRR
jgi:hypothetical protein